MRLSSQASAISTDTTTDAGTPPRPILARTRQVPPLARIAATPTAPPSSSSLSVAPTRTSTQYATTTTSPKLNTTAGKPSAASHRPRMVHLPTAAPLRIRRNTMPGTGGRSVSLKDTSLPVTGNERKGLTVPSARPAAPRTRRRSTMDIAAVAAARRRAPAAPTPALTSTAYLEHPDRVAAPAARWPGTNSTTAAGSACGRPSGVPLGSVVDLYLGATRLAWADLPGRHVQPGPRRRRGRPARGQRRHRRARRRLRAVPSGRPSAPRRLVRREFIDDLLHGGDPGRLAERAMRSGSNSPATTSSRWPRPREPFVEADDPHPPGRERRCTAASAPAAR